MLVAAGADCDCPRRDGLTPLMISAAVPTEDAPATMAALLHGGPKLELRDQQSCTALLYAIIANSPACIELLLEYGADVADCTADGKTAVHAAMRVHARRRGPLRCSPGGCTIRSHRAVSTQAARVSIWPVRPATCLEATGLLLRAGCDPDVADFQGRTVQAVVAGLCAAGEATLVRL